MFQRPFLFLTGLCAAFAAAPDALAQDTLYALDRNGPLLRDIDPTSGATLDSGRTLSLSGTPIAGAQGCARNPLTDELLALVRNSSGSQFLVTVDETNGNCTDTGTSIPDLFSDLAFDSGGTLYAISGNMGSLTATAPGELHRWAPVSGVFQFILEMTSVSNQNHAIGWNPETQKLLHNSGGSGQFSGVFEYFNPTTNSIEAPLPAGTGSGPTHNVLGAFTFKGADVFFAGGPGGYLWEIDATDTGYSQLGMAGLSIEGLARGRNDYCGNATEIGVGTFEGSLVFAASLGAASCGNSTSSPDIWYRFKAESAGNLRVTTCGTHDLPGVDLGVDTVLSLHTGCPGEASNEIVCNDDALGNECTGVDAGDGRDSAVQHAMVAGDEVLIRVSNYQDGPTGPFILNVDFDLMNDTCAVATSIGSGTTTGSLAGATMGTSGSCDGAGSGTVDGWYSYTAPAAGTLNVTTCGTYDMLGVGLGMDTILALFDGCAGTELACNDDNSTVCASMGTVRDSAVMTNVQQGQTVLIRVANYSGFGSTSTPGSFLLNLSFTRENDTCATASPIVPGNYMFNLASANATPNLACQQNDSEIWFELTAPAEGRFEVDTCGTQALGNGMDTLLSLYDSCASVTVSALACDGNGTNGPCPSNLEGYVSQDVTQGQTLLLAASKYGGYVTSSDFFLNIRFIPTFENFCNGDGGTVPGCTDCPCGNNAPSGSIGGCLNASGESARLEGSGDPSVGTDTMRFQMRGSNPNTFAILSSGPARAPANASNPCFGLDTGVQAPVFNGLRCVVSGGLGPVMRHGTRPTDNFGSVGVSNNGWGFGSGPPGGLINQGGFNVGQTRHYQVIFRELPHGFCTTSQNTSQGVTVTFTN